MIKKLVRWFVFLPVVIIVIVLKLVLKSFSLPINLSIITLNRIRVDRHVEVFASDTFVETEHIVNVLLEVTERVERLADEAPVAEPVVLRLVSFRDAVKPLEDWAEELETGHDLLAGVGRLNLSGDNSHENTLRGDLVRARYHADEDVVLPAYVDARDDDLGGLGVIRVGDGVIQEADRPNNLACARNLLTWEITWVTNHHRCLGDLHAPMLFVSLVIYLFVPDTKNIKPLTSLPHLMPQAAPSSSKRISSTSRFNRNVPPWIAHKREKPCVRCVVCVMLML